MSDERSRDLERLITFVDAIVAIAITLLVLPLADLAGQLNEGDPVATLLRHHLDELWSFLLSFVVITRLWFAQHRLLRSVDQMDALATFALMAWTLACVFLPFATALLGKAGDQTLVKVLYIGSLVANSAMLALLAYALGRESVRASQRPRVAPTLSSTIMGLLALLICVFVPAIGYYALFLLAFDGRAVQLWDRFRAARAPR